MRESNRLQRTNRIAVPLAFTASCNRHQHDWGSIFKAASLSFTVLSLYRSA